MLTDGPDTGDDFLVSGQHFGFLISTAVVTSFCACLIFLQWSTAHFAQELSSALSSLHQCLKANLETPFGIEHHDRPAILNPPLDELLTKIVALNTSYQQASFELRVGRVGGKLKVTKIKLSI